jgi:hypothetical protein
VRRQCLALGLAALLVLGCSAAWGAVRGAALQGGELSFQARLVGGEGLLEDLALLGVHALGLGTEPPGLELGELEGDALDLGVPPLDALGLRVDPLVQRVDVLGLLPDVGQHLHGQSRQFVRAQTLQIFGFELLRIEHVRIVQGHIDAVIGACLDCRGAVFALGF